jgi:anti-sigma-K factor RskA
MYAREVVPNAPALRVRSDLERRVMRRTHFGPSPSGAAEEAEWERVQLKEDQQQQQVWLSLDFWRYVVYSSRSLLPIVEALQAVC